MLPANVRTRRTTSIELDTEGVEISRATVDYPADYGWKYTNLRTGVEAWANEDDVRTDAITRRLFDGRPEGEPPTHTIEKIMADGSVGYGPREI